MAKRAVEVIDLTEDEPDWGTRKSPPAKKVHFLLPESHVSRSDSEASLSEDDFDRTQTQCWWEPQSPCSSECSLRMSQSDLDDLSPTIFDEPDEPPALTRSRAQFFLRTLVEPL
jgi:hypothetical protein